MADSSKPKKKDWVLSPDAFAKLLLQIDTDYEQAALKYLKVREKVIKTLQWEGCAPSDVDDLADETFNRVARKIDEGEAIRDFQSYSATVARFVISEYRKRRKTDPLEEATVASYNDYYKESESSHIKEVRQECFDSCLSKLAVSDRELILEYYKEERDKKIKSRQEIAKRMGVEVNALRIRTHRIRKTLEPCVKGCVRQKLGE